MSQNTRDFLFFAGAITFAIFVAVCVMAGAFHLLTLAFGEI